MRRILAVGALALWGCFGGTTSGVLIQPEDAASMSKGVTTYADVVGRFGKPTTTLLESSGRRTIIYTYVHIDADSSRAKAATAQFVFGPDQTLDSTMFSDTTPGPVR